MATDDAPNVRRLARQLVDVTRRLKHLETVPQLAHSSLDNQGLSVYDADGNLSVTLGKQEDGTYSSRPVAGPPPPAPVGLDAEGDAGLVHASWQGAFWAGAAMPRDFEAVEVLVDGNVQGAIHDPDGGSVAVPAFAGERVVSFRTLSQAGRRSDATGHVAVTVQSKASVQLGEARGRIEGAEQSLADSQVRLDEAEQTVATLRDVTLPAMRDVLEQADQDATDAIQEAVDRIGDAETAITAAEADLSSLRALLDNTDLADLEQRLAAALANIEHFQTVTMPALDQRLADAELVLAELEDIDIADLTLRLGDAETGLGELRDTTLPQLEQTITDRITTTETEVRADLDTAAGQIDTARQDLDAALAHQGAQDAALADAEDRMRVLARQAQRGHVPEPDSPMGAHWVSPSGHLYVRIECEEEVA